MMDWLDIRRWPFARRNELLCRFITEDGGQDTIEYALLAAFIGIAGYLTLQIIDDSVLAVYSGWLDPDTGTPSVWQPPEPTPGP